MGPTSDIDEVVLELDYLRNYARQHGEAAAWRVAASTIVELRRCVQDQTARLAEVEAQAAVLRDALEDVDAVHRSALGQANERGDNLTPGELFKRVRAALSLDAGRETAEWVKRLEAWVRELKEGNRKLRKAVRLACSYKELVKNFVDGLHYERRNTDSLEFFYKGVKELEQAEAELNKAIEFAREVLENDDSDV